MLKNFRTHSIAVAFYQDCKAVPLAAYSKDQLRRASFSIALNLAEGYGRTSMKDRTRFFTIALGSLRECQSIIELEGLHQLVLRADHLGASLWKLIHR